MLILLFHQISQHASRMEPTTAYTVEHLLATLHAFRITNLLIKINNEIPIMDGSALDFCQIIEDAGIEDQDELLEEFVIDEKLVSGQNQEKKQVYNH